MTNQPVTNSSMTNPMAKAYRADLLVIDDTPENLQLLSQLLTERNYKVRSVNQRKRQLSERPKLSPPNLIFARHQYASDEWL